MEMLCLLRYTAQWVGISVGGVEKCTDRVMVALLLCHDKAIHLPDAVEKERSKLYVGETMCPKWCGGFLLADVWFDKDGAYSMDCQVRLYSPSL